MFDKILCATDGSETSFGALRETYYLGLLPSAEPVELIYALSFDRVKSWGLGEMLAEEHHKVRDLALEKLKPQMDWLGKHDVEAKSRVLESTPEQCVPRVASLEDFNLIVVGRQNKGLLQRLTLGHVSQRILEQSESSVLLVPEGDRREVLKGPRTILVPTDFSACSKQGIDTAAQMAKTYGFKIQLIYCESYREFFAGFNGMANYEALLSFWKKHIEDAKEKLAVFCKELTDQGIEAASSILDDSVWSGLEKAVAETEACLIVMASHGRSGWQKLWLGSVTERVLKHSSVPVLVVKSEDPSDA